MNSYLKQIIEYISGNEFITGGLMKSVFYIDLVDHPKASIFLFLTTLIFSLYLFIDLFIQTKKKNYFSLFFTFLFFMISLIPTGITSYIFYLESKPNISKITPIGKPFKVKNMDYTNEYYFLENGDVFIYKVNKKCIVNINEEVNLYENQKRFSFFAIDNNPDCRFIKIDNNSINID